MGNRALTTFSASSSTGNPVILLLTSISKAATQTTLAPRIEYLAHEALPLWLMPSRGDCTAALYLHQLWYLVSQRRPSWTSSRLQPSSCRFPAIDACWLLWLIISFLHWCASSKPESKDADIPRLRFFRSIRGNISFVCIRCQSFIFDFTLPPGIICASSATCAVALWTYLRELCWLCLEVNPAILAVKWVKHRSFSTRHGHGNAVLPEKLARSVMKL